MEVPLDCPKLDRVCLRTVSLSIYDLHTCLLLQTTLLDRQRCFTGIFLPPSFPIPHPPSPIRISLSWYRSAVLVMSAFLGVYVLPQLLCDNCSSRQLS